MRQEACIIPPMRELGILESIVIDTEFIGHEGIFPFTKDFLSIDNLRKIPAVELWLQHKVITDDGIEDVIGLLVKTAQKYIDDYEYVSHDPDLDFVTSTEEKEEYEYQQLIRQICVEISADLLSEGITFRKIIQQYGEIGLSKVLGEEDVRDWLQTKTSETMSVFDVEKAVVGATILYIAETRDVATNPKYFQN